MFLDDEVCTIKQLRMSTQGSTFYSSEWVAAKAEDDEKKRKQGNGSGQEQPAKVLKGNPTNKKKLTESKSDSESGKENS